MCPVASLVAATTSSRAIAPTTQCNTNLSVFTIDGSPVIDGATVNKSNGTSSVTVVATPQDPSASALPSGTSGLTTGNNTVSVLVTAADGVTTRTYTVTIHVLNTGVFASTGLTAFQGASYYGTPDARFFVLYGPSNTPYCFWFFAGGQMAPPVSGIFSQIDIGDLGDGDSATIAERASAAVVAAGNWTTDYSAGDGFVATATAAGTRTDAYGDACTITTTNQGANPS